MALELASAVLLRTSAIDVLLCVAVTLETQPQKSHLDGRISQNGVENRNPRQKMALEDDLGITSGHEMNGKSDSGETRTHAGRAQCISSASP